jgi:hypothetical protein
MIAKLALLLSAALSPAVQAQQRHPTGMVTPLLAEARAFASAHGDDVWVGYGAAPFGFLLVTPKAEYLLCRDAVPQSFTPDGTDPATGCTRHRRPPSGLPSTLLAAMPVFGLPGDIVMGTPETTGRPEAAWLRTILHEHFHQWQYALPAYFERLQALDLHGGDQSGMWVLNYPFPYTDESVNDAFARASNLLAEAAAARGKPEFAHAFDRYLEARRALAVSAGEKNWRYFEFQLWQEGVARWTEIRLGKWFPRQDVRDSAVELEQATLESLRSSQLARTKREIVYAYGAAEAMLLQACGHGWRALYRQVLALGPLLDAARTSCAAQPVHTQ